MRRSICHLIVVSMFAAGLTCPCEVPGYLRESVNKIKPNRNALTAYPVSGPYGRAVQALFSSNGSTWAGTENGMYVTEDPAMGWHAVSNQGQSSDEDTLRGVSAFAQIGNALFVGDVYDIFRSDDAGKSWKKWLPVSVKEGTLMPVTGLVAIKNRLFVSTTIRKFNRWYTSDELIASGSLPAHVRNEVVKLMNAKKNGIISGGTGPGRRP